MKNVTLRYYCQPTVGWATNYYKTLTSLDFSDPLYYIIDENFNTHNIDNVLPWYDNTNRFKRNNLEFFITYIDDTTSSHTLTSYVIDAETSYYANRDTTFYYVNPTNNSFVSFKTGYSSQFGSGACYNCLSYAIHKESSGSLWPFENNNNYAAVIYWLYTQGYTHNTTTNHNFCHVIAYGDPNTSQTAHFAKVTDWDSDGTPLEINSKWGAMEVIHSSSIAPFTSAIGYGVPLMYFNKSNNNNSSICYNPTTNKYYDSDYKTWDPTTQSYHYIDVLFSENGTSQISVEPNIELQCSDELSQIYNTYNEKILKYKQSDPNYKSISYVITDDENGAADELIKSSIPYFNQIFDIATKTGYKNFDSRTAQFVITNSLHLNVFYSKPEQYLNDVREQLKSATVSIKKFEGNISREDCIKLQNKYGYLIAPALKDIGKLDYLTLEETDICQDLNKLIELCNLFE